MVSRKDDTPLSSPLRAFKNPIRVISIGRILHLWFRTYFDAQKKTNPDDAIIIESAIDNRIPPDEQAIYPYLFACLYIMYIVWHMLDKLSPEQSRSAYDAYDSLIRESETIFLAKPTRMKNRNRTSHPLTAFVQSIDGPTNCFPSLHVSLISLSYQIIKDDPGTDPLLISAMRKSCIDICRSTMKTKQHSIIDVIGGIAITQKTYKNFFKGTFEDMLEEVLPELRKDELLETRSYLKECDDMMVLMDRLVSSNWSAD